MEDGKMRILALIPADSWYAIEARQMDDGSWSPRATRVTAWAAVRQSEGGKGGLVDSIQGFAGDRCIMPVEKGRHFLGYAFSSGGNAPGGVGKLRLVDWSQEAAEHGAREARAQEYGKAIRGKAGGRKRSSEAKAEAAATGASDDIS